VEAEAKENEAEVDHEPKDRSELDQEIDQEIDEEEVEVVIEAEIEIEVGIGAAAEVDHLEDEEAEVVKVDLEADLEMKDEDVLEIVHEREVEVDEEHRVVQGVEKNLPSSHRKKEINVQCFVCNYPLALGLETWKSFLQLLVK
jgi:hypothetical protein